MPQSSWKNWGDHPIVVLISLVSGIIAIVSFFILKEGKPHYPNQSEVQSNSKSQPQVERSSSPPGIAAPMNITVNDGVLVVNDQVLRFPSNLNRLVSIFGNPSRKLSKHNTIYVWDDIGVFCYEDRSSSEIKQLSIALNDHNRTSPIKFEFWPHKIFSGSLSIDGAALNSASKVPDINKQKSGKIFEQRSDWGTAWRLEYTYTAITLVVNWDQKVIGVDIANKQ